ncbi:hypothetical protein [Micromonospora aurantiaca (nom. illeg.)]|uniref:hypothetical protein n=1 Tax=Micromonospora aurantiaca (nom. illeg.) TaxID=47850 RepID=UPI0033FBA0D8
MPSADELGWALIGRIDVGDPDEFLSPSTAELVRDLLVAAVSGDAGHLVDLDDVAERHFELATSVSGFLTRLFTAAGDAGSASVQGERARRLSIVRDRGRSLAARELALAEVLLADASTDSVAVEVALALHRRALGRGPDLTQSAESLVQFGIAYRERGTVQRSPDDLGRAVDLTRRALADLTLLPQHRADVLSMLALALTARFELGGRDPRDLTEALIVARESASADTGPGRYTRLNNLGFVLNANLHHRGDWSLLAELIPVAESAVATADNQHDRANAWVLLSIALGRRAEATGNLNDLTEAVTRARAAVAASEGRPEQAGHLFNLAKLCLDRYEFVHSIEDLDSAVTYARAAREAMDDGDPRRGDLLSLLSSALENRFGLRRKVDDLLEAVDVCEEAVLGSPPSSVRHAAMLSNLGNIRRVLAEWTQQLSDINEAIRVATRAATIDGEQGPSRRSNLAACYVERFRIDGDIGDLDHAVELLRQALARVPTGAPSRAAFLSELGQRLVERYSAAPAASHALTEAIGLFREAAELETAPGLDRFRAASRWGLAADQHGRHLDAAEGSATAVSLLPLVAWHGLDRRSQEAQLRRWSLIVTMAAAQAITLDRLHTSVELLEQGRNVLWAHQLGRRADLNDLRAVAPDLADRMDAVRRALDAMTGPVRERGR